jgi:hypothetical protein
MALEIQILAWDRHKNVAGLSGMQGSRVFVLPYSSSRYFQEQNVA